MDSGFTEITYDVHLQPGEKLALPDEAVEIVGPGHWLVSIRPADGASPSVPTRNHAAFLNSYSREDEGLYDDCSAG
jgi:hypothetical protein